ncbi:hypothetical protein Pcinc_010154 [Petrolisthes cinctipes]|uniref:Uncharacterized protein n=1 Tax=Petrolisthes cinctipes TaxID=88211 RepID=A0AAE1KVQ2_PETCI|nr:hypothetical protein Pcinc_010154 [Petrolisthes cinctipes]
MGGEVGDEGRGLGVFKERVGVVRFNLSEGDGVQISLLTLPLVTIRAWKENRESHFTFCLTLHILSSHTSHSFCLTLPHSASSHFHTQHIFCLTTHTFPHTSLPCLTQHILPHNSHLPSHFIITLPPTSLPCLTTHTFPHTSLPYLTLHYPASQLTPSLTLHYPTSHFITLPHNSHLPSHFITLPHTSLPCLTQHNTFCLNNSHLPSLSLSRHSTHTLSLPCEETGTGLGEASSITQCRGGREGGSGGRGVGEGGERGVGGGWRGVGGGRGEEWVVGGEEWVVGGEGWVVVGEEWVVVGVEEWVGGGGRGIDGVL